MGIDKAKYDIEGLAVELEVEIGDLATLFVNYIYEMKNEILNMKEYLDKKDWNMLERVVHNIKGVSANLTINDVFEAAAAFDLQLKNNMTDEAADNVDKITKMIKNSEAYIKDFFQKKGFSV